MARRGREAALKRVREKARQDKKDAKRERLEARQEDQAAEIPVDETALMEEFARLSERHETNQITTKTYDEERHRIFVQLGIESAE